MIELTEDSGYKWLNPTEKELAELSHMLGLNTSEKEKELNNLSSRSPELPSPCSSSFSISSSLLPTSLGRRGEIVLSVGRVTNRDIDMQRVLLVSPKCATGLPLTFFNLPLLHT